MAQSPGSSPGNRRRSDGSVRESLFFPVYERNEQEPLEARVRRRAGGGHREEAREQLENRPKRWTWGGPPDGAEVVDFLAPPTMDQPIKKQLSSSSVALHSAEKVSTNRATRSSSNRRSIAGFPEDNNRVRRGESPNVPVRSPSFRSNSKGPSTPKRGRSNRNRAQSPCSPGQLLPSPLRQRGSAPGPEDRGHAELKGHGTLERKVPKHETSEKKIPKSSSRELGAESPGTPSGRSVGGTTDAEEASRLLTERRRLARIQKEQEEREREEEERLRVQEEQRRQEEEQQRQQREEKEREEERRSREEEKRSREEEERRQKERRWKDMQEQLDREREEAFLRAQQEAEKKRQQREKLHIQEEQERQQRKKRIEEIMKRTRKSEVDPPSSASVLEVKPEAGGPSENSLTSAEAPVISLGPLENKSCVDELSDGVQSMDVSPVSRDEPPSSHDFSPLAEDHLMEEPLAPASPAYPRLQAGSGVGDLNKNLLIQAYSANEAPPLIHSGAPSKLHLQ